MTSKYRSKRRFEETPEPAGGTGSDLDPGRARPGERFVIQQHHATRLHHDLRLEMSGDAAPVLVSWAVPKGLPLRSGERALAIRTEDHPMEYATFSGTIPEGNYGAGEVRIFDSGGYRLLEQRPGRLTVELAGSRLQGVWHLVQTGSEGGKEQWLAILSEDRRPPRQPPPPPDPMLATPAADAFDDPGWGFEPKWDGIRAIAVCSDSTALITRNRNDVTVAYPELSRLHEQLVAIEAMVDGEIVAFEGGVPSFERLQQRMHVRDLRQVERLSRSIPVVYMAFDLIYLDGRDLTGQPWEERRRLLEETVVAAEVIQVSPAVEEQGRALFDAASRQRLEGMLAKRRGSRYEPGRRSRSWLKVKTTMDADVVVGGWREGEGRRAGELGSLLCGVYHEGGLRYVGRVGTGFSDRLLRELGERLRRLETRSSPFAAEEVRSVPELRRARWVEPQLVATVEFRQLTSAGRLRAPSFKGLREDKRPEECTLEELRAAAGG